MIPNTMVFPVPDLALSIKSVNKFNVWRCLYRIHERNELKFIRLINYLPIPQRPRGIAFSCIGDGFSKPQFVKPSSKGCDKPIWKNVMSSSIFMSAVRRLTFILWATDFAIVTDYLDDNSTTIIQDCENFVWLSFQKNMYGEKWKFLTYRRRRSETCAQT